MDVAVAATVAVAVADEERVGVAVPGVPVGAFSVGVLVGVVPLAVGVAGLWVGVAVRAGVGVRVGGLGASVGVASRGSDGTGTGVGVISPGAVGIGVAVGVASVLAARSTASVANPRQYNNTVMKKMAATKA